MLFSSTDSNSRFIYSVENLSVLYSILGACPNLICVSILSGITSIFVSKILRYFK